jgi:hypothetical protein
MIYSKFVPYRYKNGYIMERCKLDLSCGTEFICSAWKKPNKLSGKHDVYFVNKHDAEFALKQVISEWHNEDYNAEICEETIDGIKCYSIPEWDSLDSCIVL